MSRHGFSVAYDAGRATPTMAMDEMSSGSPNTGVSWRSDHSIDVDTLAPALLAFGKLIREANAEFNGKRTTARVLVVSDFEHKCFNINFDVVLSWYDQLKTFLEAEDVKSAKDILDWIFSLGATAAALRSISFIRFLDWKAGRRVASTKTISDKDQDGLVEVTVEGDDNSIIVNQHVYNLSINAKALRAARDTLLPLGQNGLEVVRIKEGGETVQEIGLPEVKRIVASCAVGLEEAKETEPDIQVTPAWLSVYSPVYDAKAENWRFRLGTDIIYADITETKIAQDALERGGALAEDAYQVRLEITTDVDPQGKEKRTYKILEVVLFVPGSPMHQTSLLTPPPQRRPPRKR